MRQKHWLRPTSYAHADLPRWYYTLNSVIRVARTLRRSQANERVIFTVGLLSERFRANASFKPTQLKRSLKCMTASLIFLNPFCIKTKRIRPAVESVFLNLNYE